MSMYGRGCVGKLFFCCVPHNSGCRCATHTHCTWRYDGSSLKHCGGLHQHRRHVFMFKAISIRLLSGVETTCTLLSLG